MQHRNATIRNPAQCSPSGVPQNVIMGSARNREIKNTNF